MPEVQERGVRSPALCRCASTCDGPPTATVAAHDPGEARLPQGLGKRCAERGGRGQQATPLHLSVDHNLQRKLRQRGYDPSPKQPRMRQGVLLDNRGGQR